jgi:ABC-type transport system substrate-binding protein
MMWVAMNLGCGLVNITPDGQFVGDAATSWEVSADGLTYTFTLHDNVLFHDGTKVDAAAVKFSIDHLMDPETKSGMRRFYEPVKSVDVVDPLTVRVQMKRPYAFFLHMLAGYRTGLVLYSPTATKKYGLEERKKGQPEAVVGCGPFKLVEWVPGNHLVMDRWDKYFKPQQPYLDRVLIRVIKDPITQMAAFKAGEIDMILSFTPEHVDTLKAQNPKEYIEACRALGQYDPKILLRHILPNCMAPIIVTGTLSIATAIIVEASLSFLGLGTQPPTPSWGWDLKANVPWIQLNPWLALGPGCAIFLTVLGFNLFGDGMRDALDPRLK